MTESRKSIVEARNALARCVVRARREGHDFDFALWCDADAWWFPGAVERMVSTMVQRPDVDLLAAYSGERLPFACASAYVRMGDELVGIVPNGGSVIGALADRPHRTFAPGDVVDVDYVSLHFAMMRASLLERVGDRAFDVPPGSRYGEDFVFCDVVRRAGAKVAVDTGAVAAHVDIESGFAFVPNARPGRIVGGAFEFAADSRADDAIRDEWAPRIMETRRNRTYGAEVDGVLRSIGHAVAIETPS